MGCFSPWNRLWLGPSKSVLASIAPPVVDVFIVVTLSPPDFCRFSNFCRQVLHRPLLSKGLGKKSMAEVGLLGLDQALSGDPAAQLQMDASPAGGEPLPTYADAFPPLQSSQGAESTAPPTWANKTPVFRSSTVTQVCFCSMYGAVPRTRGYNMLEISVWCWRKPVELPVLTRCGKKCSASIQTGR